MHESLGFTKPTGEVKAKVSERIPRADPDPARAGAGSGLTLSIVRGEYQECSWWDPKDGELCLARMKPEETLVEVRSDSDVQIDRRSWV